MSLRSLLPHSDLDRETVNNCADIFCSHKLSNDRQVSLAVPVHLAGSHVLELGVIDQLLRDTLASNKHDTHKLEVWLVSEHEELAERVLSEVFESLDETFKEVLEHVANLTLFAHLLIVKEPKSVAFFINLFHELIETHTTLVGTVHEESLEVEQIEGGRGQEFKSALNLLFGTLIAIIGGSFGLSSSSDGFGLLLRLDDGLDRFLGHLDLSEDRDELGEGGDALKPGASLGSGFCEALIEDKLECYGKAYGEDNVSNCYIGANKPVTGKALIDRS